MSSERSVAGPSRSAMMIIFAIVVIDLIGFGIIIPLLPFYGEHFGAEPDQVAYLMAIYSLTQFLAAPLWGRLSDRIGRRPVLLVSLAGIVGSYVWLATADSLTSLFIARAVGGAMAGNIAAAFAYMADITTPENRAKGMGLIGAAFGLGFTAGPAIGGILGGADPNAVNFQLPAYVAGGFSLVALILAAILLKESLPQEIRDHLNAQSTAERWRAFGRTLAKPEVRLVVILNFLAVSGIAGIEATFAIWSNREFGWGVAQNGYLFAYMGLIMALIQGSLAGPLSRRLGEINMIRIGMLALVLGFVAAPLSPNFATLIAAITVMAIGFAIATPGLNSLLSLRVAADQQGGVLGVGRAAATMARILGPALAGILFAELGRDWPFHMGALIIGAALIIAVVWLRPTPQSS